MLGHHAHDCADDAVDRDRFVEDVWVAAEASLPETVRDDRDLVLAGLILFGRRSCDRGSALCGYVEKVRRDQNPPEYVRGSMPVSSRSTNDKDRVVQTIEFVTASRDSSRL